MPPPSSTPPPSPPPPSSLIPPRPSAVETAEAVTTLTSAPLTPRSRRRRSVVSEEECYGRVIEDDGYYLERMREILEAPPRIKPPINHVRLCDHVFMGSQRNAEDIEALQRDGIRYVLSCVQARRSTESPYDRATSGVRGFLLIPAEDREDFDISQYFDGAVRFLEEVRSVQPEGGRALIHCNMGVNRSGAVAAAYLMVSQRRNLLDVITFMKRKRHALLSNKGFRRQLVAFARRNGLLDPVVDTVTRITYSRPRLPGETEVLGDLAQVAKPRIRPNREGNVEQKEVEKNREIDQVVDSEIAQRNRQHVESSWKENWRKFSCQPNDISSREIESSGEINCPEFKNKIPLNGQIHKSNALHFSDSVSQVQPKSKDDSPVSEKAYADDSTPGGKCSKRDSEQAANCVSLRNKLQADKDILSKIFSDKAHSDTLSSDNDQPSNQHTLKSASDDFNPNRFCYENSSDPQASLGRIMNGIVGKRRIARSQADDALPDNKVSEILKTPTHRRRGSSAVAATEPSTKPAFQNSQPEDIFDRVKDVSSNGLSYGRCRSSWPSASSPEFQDNNASWQSSVTQPYSARNTNDGFRAAQIDNSGALSTAHTSTVARSTRPNAASAVTTCVAGDISATGDLSCSVHPVTVAIGKKFEHLFSSSTGSKESKVGTPNENTNSVNATPGISNVNDKMEKDFVAKFNLNLSDASRSTVIGLNRSRRQSTPPVKLASECIQNGLQKIDGGQTSSSGTGTTALRLTLQSQPNIETSALVGFDKAKTSTGRLPETPLISVTSNTGRVSAAIGALKKHAEQPADTTKFSLKTSASNLVTKMSSSPPGQNTTKMRSTKLPLQSTVSNKETSTTPATTVEMLASNKLASLKNIWAPKSTAASIAASISNLPTASTTTTQSLPEMASVDMQHSKRKASVIIDVPIKRISSMSSNMKSSGIIPIPLVEVKSRTNSGLLQNLSSGQINVYKLLETTPEDPTAKLVMQNDARDSCQTSQKLNRPSSRKASIESISPHGTVSTNMRRIASPESSEHRWGKFHATANMNVLGISVNDAKEATFSPVNSPTKSAKSSNQKEIKSIIMLKPVPDAATMLRREILPPRPVLTQATTISPVLTPVTTVSKVGPALPVLTPSTTVSQVGPTLYSKKQPSWTIVSDMMPPKTEVQEVQLSTTPLKPLSNLPLQSHMLSEIKQKTSSSTQSPSGTLYVVPPYSENRILMHNDSVTMDTHEAPTYTMPTHPGNIATRSQDTMKYSCNDSMLLQNMSKTKSLDRASGKNNKHSTEMVPDQTLQDHHSTSASNTSKLNQTQMGQCEANMLKNVQNQADNVILTGGFDSWPRSGKHSAGSRYASWLSSKYSDEDLDMYEKEYATMPAEEGKDAGVSSSLNYKSVPRAWNDKQRDFSIPSTNRNRSDDVRESLPYYFSVPPYRHYSSVQQTVADHNRYQPTSTYSTEPAYANATQNDATDKENQSLHRNAALRRPSVDSAYQQYHRGWSGSYSIKPPLTIMRLHGLNDTFNHGSFMVEDLLSGIHRKRHESGISSVSPSSSAADARNQNFGLSEIDVQPMKSNITFTSRQQIPAATSGTQTSQPSSSSATYPYVLAAGKSRPPRRPVTPPSQQSVFEGMLTSTHCSPPSSSSPPPPIPPRMFSTGHSLSLSSPNSPATSRAPFFAPRPVTTSRPPSPSSPASDIHQHRHLPAVSTSTLPHYSHTIRPPIFDQSSSRPWNLNEQYQDGIRSGEPAAQTQRYSRTFKPALNAIDPLSPGQRATAGDINNVQHLEGTGAGEPYSGFLVLLGTKPAAAGRSMSSWNLASTPSVSPAGCSPTVTMTTSMTGDFTSAGGLRAARRYERSHTDTELVG